MTLRSELRDLQKISNLVLQHIAIIIVTTVSRRWNKFIHGVQKLVVAALQNYFIFRLSFSMGFRKLLRLCKHNKQNMSIRRPSHCAAIVTKRISRPQNCVSFERLIIIIDYFYQAFSTVSYWHVHKLLSSEKWLIVKNVTTWVVKEFYDLQMWRGFVVM